MQNHSPLFKDTTDAEYGLFMSMFEKELKDDRSLIWAKVRETKYRTLLILLNEFFSILLGNSDFQIIFPKC